MRMVVKVGTSTLTDNTDRVKAERVEDLARQIATLGRDGHEVILVTSGAVAFGRAALNSPRLPKDIPAKQMLASVGQPRLMAQYDRAFGAMGMMVAQVLLTRADLNDRRSYLNARNTLAALLGQHILPIVNENDTVATEEIRVGDNDNLSALVSNLVDADWLILLTDQPGLFTADPRQDASASLIDEISETAIPAWLWQAAGGAASSQGTGGMVTKVQAADLARRSGTSVVIASGGEPDILRRIVQGERIGTRFTTLEGALESRKRYILAGGAAGRLTADAGAAQALQRGGSLLPVGVTAVDGTFERGDTVMIVDAGGIEIARGIVNYRDVDLARIMRRKSDEIEGLLGFHYGDEVIHRSNLVLL